MMSVDTTVCINIRSVLTTTYRGRFAPTPTGPLHLGSLVSAMASYLEARRHQGDWLLRIDDIDQTRCRPSLAEHIVQTLHQFGFRWQEPVQYQQQHQTYYQQALHQLQQRGLLYACDCSRQQLRHTAVYPGTCRELARPNAPGYALRVRTDQRLIHLHDAGQGPRQQRLSDTCGDFIVRRRDGLIAYQLAVVVDDYQARITHVVRGADLLDSTHRQIYLQQLLQYPIPHYCHIPLVLDPDGKKLSKSTAAMPIEPTRPLPALRTAWRFLQPTSPPSTLRNEADFWHWAIQHWTYPKRG